MAGSRHLGSVTIAAWLTVPDGPRALEWYRTAFGAVAGYTLDQDGRTVVARLALGDAQFWLAEEPGAAAAADRPAIRLILTVPDPRAVVDCAVAAGARTVAAVHEEHGWLVGRVADPFGHHWEVGRPFPA